MSTVQTDVCIECRGSVFTLAPPADSSHNVLMMTCILCGSQKLPKKVTAYAGEKAYRDDRAARDFQAAKIRKRKGNRYYKYVDMLELWTDNWVRIIEGEDYDKEEKPFIH